MMAGGDGEVALRDPEALIQEIERTREDLARNIGVLADRVSPASIARRTMSRVRAELSRPEVATGGAAVLVSAAVVSYLIWRRRR